MCLLRDLANARFFEKIYGVVYFVCVFHLYKWYFASEHLLFLIFFHLTHVFKISPYQCVSLWHPVHGPYRCVCCMPTLRFRDPLSCDPWPLRSVPPNILLAFPSDPGQEILCGKQREECCPEGSELDLIFLRRA